MSLVRALPPQPPNLEPHGVWPQSTPDLEAVLRLKDEMNAIILAHNYQSPDIVHGVADIVGDSLALARAAVKVDADVIVMAGVHFMAETAKLLNPEKTVLIPDLRAGCSLADSITAADIRLLREAYPNTPVVTYVNTSAEVKAESDICCTSGNAVEVVESLGVDQVLFLPDAYLASWVATQTKVKIIAWKGHCEVHHQFTGAQLRAFRGRHEGLTIIAHPECPPEVLAEADFVGSTARMIDFVGERKPPKVMLVTECSMSDTVAVHAPETQFVRACILCPHMQRITMPKIHWALRSMAHIVEVDETVAARARVAVERMIAVGKG
jgi:quinolinate synthase